MSEASALGTSNTAWPDLGRNPKGLGHFTPELCYISLMHNEYTALNVPRFGKKWPPALFYH
jgi:hypothetical protein